MDPYRYRVSIILIYHKNLTLLSTTISQLLSSPQDKNITWDTFGTTQKPVPTYAVSFMVSDFNLLKLTKNRKLRYEVKRVPMASSIEKQLSKKMTNTIYYMKTFTQIDMKDDADNYEIYMIPSSANFVLDDWEMKLFG